MKTTDSGLSYHLEEAVRPGGTREYIPPENVVGMRNYGARSDVFAAAIILVETCLGRPVLPTRLTEAYAKGDGADGSITTLYHLVLLSTLMAMRPVWAGRMIRTCYSKCSKHVTLTRVSLVVPSAEVEVASFAVSRQRH